MQHVHLQLRLYRVHTGAVSHTPLRRDIGRLCCRSGAGEAVRSQAQQGTVRRSGALQSPVWLPHRLQLRDAGAQPVGARMAAQRVLDQRALRRVPVGARSWLLRPQRGVRRPAPAVSWYRTALTSGEHLHCWSRRLKFRMCVGLSHGDTSSGSIQCIRRAASRGARVDPASIRRADRSAGGHLSGVGLPSQISGRRPAALCTDPSSPVAHPQELYRPLKRAIGKMPWVLQPPPPSTRAARESRDVVGAFHTDLCFA